MKLMSKEVARIIIALAMFYWIMILASLMTGCQTYEYDVKYEDIDKRLQALDIESKKYTLSLDPMDRTQYHEREEFLQLFE